MPDYTPEQAREAVKALRKRASIPHSVWKDGKLVPTPSMYAVLVALLEDVAKPERCAEFNKPRGEDGDLPRLRCCDFIKPEHSCGGCIAADALEGRDG
jgi:hypothetical protein